MVLAGGALIAWELWYFLAPPRREAPPRAAGVQEIHVRVRQGFEPDVIPVEVGLPVRLVFHRDETAECTGELIFETLDLRYALPAFTPTVVEFTPSVAGDYPFRCGHTDFRGRVLAQTGAAAARTDAGRGHRRHA